MINIKNMIENALLKVPGAPFLKDILIKGVLWREYISDFISFRRLSIQLPNRFSVRWKDRWPCLNEKTADTGFDRHYVYHTAWASRILAKNKPEQHVDISSLLYFAGIVSAFVPVYFYDYRPPDFQVENLHVGRADLIRLHFVDRSINSLSCMHVIEHIGLGRYGELLDPEGDLKAISELKRVLAPGGDLLIAVPVGERRIMFNAHRIYSYDQITEYFSGLKLMEFSLITENPDGGGLIVGATREMANAQKYGCGCFWFRRGHD